MDHTWQPSQEAGVEGHLEEEQMQEDGKTEKERQDAEVLLGGFVVGRGR